MRQPFSRFTKTNPAYKDLQFYVLKEELLEYKQKLVFTRYSKELGAHFIAYHEQCYNKSIRDVKGFDTNNTIGLHQYKKVDKSGSEEGGYLVFSISYPTASEDYLLCQNGKPLFVDNFKEWSEAFLDAFYNYLEEKKGENLANRKEHEKVLAEHANPFLFTGKDSFGMHFNRGEAFAVFSVAHRFSSSERKKAFALVEIAAFQDFVTNLTDAQYQEDGKSHCDCFVIIYCSQRKAWERFVSMIRMVCSDESFGFDKVLLVDFDKKAFWIKAAGKRTESIGKFDPANGVNLLGLNCKDELAFYKSPDLFTIGELYLKFKEYRGWHRNKETFNNYRARLYHDKSIETYQSVCRDMLKALREEKSFETTDRQ